MTFGFKLKTGARTELWADSPTERSIQAAAPLLLPFALMPTAVLSVFATNAPTGRSVSSTLPSEAFRVLPLDTKTVRSLVVMVVAVGSSLILTLGTALATATNSKTNNADRVFKEFIIQ